MKHNSYKVKKDSTDDERRKFLDMLSQRRLNMEYAKMIEIERAIVDIFDARRDEIGMSIDALGKKVYPTDASPRMRIQSLRKPQANGKPRRLPVGDFIAMCEALDMDHVRVLIDAAERR